MPFDPAPFDFMGRGGRVELLPQVAVFHRLLLRCLPAVTFPASQPTRDPLSDVLRVGGERDLRAAFQTRSGLRLRRVIPFGCLSCRVRPRSPDVRPPRCAATQPSPPARDCLGTRHRCRCRPNCSRTATGRQLRISNGCKLARGKALFLPNGSGTNRLFACLDNIHTTKRGS